MGIAANQARLFVLTARKADINYNLTILTNQYQQLTARKSEEIQKKSAAINEYYNGGEDKKVAFENTKANMDYENAMAELEAADNLLILRKEAAETELQAVSKEEEEIEKLVSSNIKESFKYFN